MGVVFVMKKLSYYTYGKDNNFNFIRFIAASLVIFSHSFPLLMGIDEDPLRKLTGTSFGGLAVDIFFITSGFLICKSFLSKPHIIDYALSRILRIYPALIVAILFCVFIVGPAYTKLSLSSYLSDQNTYTYWLRNSILFLNIQHDLPGVFSDLPYPAAVNGSLWTLPYEVYMYIGLAVTMLMIGLIGKLTHTSQKWLLVSIAAISTGIHLVNTETEFYEGPLLRLHSMFFTGAAFFVARDIVPLNVRIALPLMIGLLISGLNIHGFHIMYSLSLAYLIFYLAYIPEGAVRKFNLVGDYSYGIYIYAFPVQQVFVSAGLTDSPYLLTVMAFVPTVCLAWLSWNLVEKQALKIKGLILNPSRKRLRVLTFMEQILPKP